MDTPQEVLDNELPFNPTYFNVPIGNMDKSDVLIACLVEQSTMNSWPDELGNLQAGVRLDIVATTYWVSAKEGTQQSDIDTAVANYATKLGGMYP